MSNKVAEATESKPRVARNYNKCLSSLFAIHRKKAPEDRSVDERCLDILASTTRRKKADLRRALIPLLQQNEDDVKIFESLKIEPDMMSNFDQCVFHRMESIQNSVKGMLGWTSNNEEKVVLDVQSVVSPKDTTPFSTDSDVPKGSADGAVSFHGFRHVNNLFTTIAELSRAVKIGGYLIIGDFECHVKKTVDIYVVNFIDALFGYLRGKPCRPRQVHDRFEWSNMLSSHGFARRATIVYDDHARTFYSLFQRKDNTK
jgi:hypothetical protein